MKKKVIKKSQTNLDLALGELEQGGELDAPWPAQVAREVELLLELDELGARVGGAGALRRGRGAATAVVLCRRGRGLVLWQVHAEKRRVG